MIKPIFKNETTVVFGPCRLSYTHLLVKYTPEGSAEGKYMTNVLIPKSEVATIKALQKAIEAAQEKGILNRWQGKLPKKLDIALRDGDEKDDELYHGHYYLNAKCNTRPGVVDKDGVPIVDEDEDEVYSGMWALVSLSFYAYDVNGNRGIAAGLNNVKKTKDDERLGGRSSAESDFDGIDLDDDDDDL